MDTEQCYRAMRSRDARFDGWFVTAVTSTRIYCRPSCPARAPKPTNVVFHPTAAAAQGAGFRACKRCRPDASPGSPQWNARADVIGRAMRLIADGVVDRDGVRGLAAQLGYSERQLHRQLCAEVGTGALALARAQRAQTARLLLETTDLAAAEVAFAAGFDSIRQFNDTIREVFALTPTGLRARVGGRGEPTPGRLELRLPFRAPLDWPALLGFLVARAVPGIEVGDAGRYRRTLALPYAPGTVEITTGPPGAGYLRCALRLRDVRDLGAAVQRCRRLFDLDADPVAVDGALGADPLLAPLVAATPGRRAPGHVDGSELAIRAVLGQQISVAGARTLATRLVTRYGQPLPGGPEDGLTAVFPTAETLADADPTEWPMPRSRARALSALATALATGRLTLDPGADREETERRLLALPGIGPWTAAYVRMRALGDPDAFLPTDLGVRHGLAHLGAAGDPAAATDRAKRWRPWRSYAVSLLWTVPPPAGRQHRTTRPSQIRQTPTGA